MNYKRTYNISIKMDELSEGVFKEISKAIEFVLDTHQEDGVIRTYVVVVDPVNPNPKIMAQSGIEMIGEAILHVLKEAGPLRGKDISDRLGIPPYTGGKEKNKTGCMNYGVVHCILRKLQEEGYVQCSSKKGFRELTQKGHNLFTDR